MKTNLNKSIIYVDENLTKKHKQYIHKIHKPPSSASRNQRQAWGGGGGGARRIARRQRVPANTTCVTSTYSKCITCILYIKS